MEKINFYKDQLDKAVKREQSMVEVLNVVCEVTHTSPERIKSTSRKREYVDARYLFFYVMKYAELNHFTLEELGEFVGRDHSTVLAGRARIEDLLTFDKKIKRELNAITVMLNLILAPMTTEQLIEVSNLKRTQLENLQAWLVEHPDNPYRSKVMEDVRVLEQDLKDQEQKAA